MKQKVLEVIKKAIRESKVKLEDEKILSMIEVPKDYSYGDYAFPCFALAAILKMSPKDIAIELKKKIGNPPIEFSSIETEGPYINFFLNRDSIFYDLIRQIKKEKDNFGKNSDGKGEKTMIEFPSPNTNKPLHLGHLRNMSIGESVSRISEASAEKVVRSNLNNDRGVHICKSMLAYQKWGKEKSPKKGEKSDHFVGDFYVMFSKKAKEKPKLENEAHVLLGKWEKGDKKTVELWKKMNKWAFEGFNETYKNFGVTHDKEYYESEIYKNGKEIIIEAAKRGVFEKLPDGSIKYDMKKEGLGEKYLLRSDGTSLYMTQDIYLAYLKQKEFKLTKNYYVVGNEQIYHFKVLFKILEKLKIPLKGLKHLAYGMVNLPEGKMKSREGTVVDADDLIEKVEELVKKQISKREKLKKTELEKRAHTVALAAIKYMLLKIDIKKDMTFDPKKSISFEGNTGPYLLYSYARATSIIKKSKKEGKINANKEFEEKETELMLKINEFPDAVKKAYNTLDPSIIANYSYELSKIFNEFYHTNEVIGSQKEDLRINIINSFRQTLKNSLYLLGIDVLEKM